jgi:hypothetical protein
MTMRATTKTVTFHRPFYLKGVDRLLPPADYRVVTDEELIDGLSFAAYRRVSTAIFVPAEFGSAVEMISIDPFDLQVAQDQDVGRLGKPLDGVGTGGTR